MTDGLVAASHYTCAIPAPGRRTNNSGPSRRETRIIRYAGAKTRNNGKRYAALPWMVPLTERQGLLLQKCAALGKMRNSTKLVRNLYETCHKNKRNCETCSFQKNKITPYLFFFLWSQKFRSFVCFCDKFRTSFVQVSYKFRIFSGHGARSLSMALLSRTEAQASKFRVRLLRSPSTARLPKTGRKLCAFPTLSL